jgi:hypothetical protein
LSCVAQLFVVMAEKRLHLELEGVDDARKNQLQDRIQSKVLDMLGDDQDDMSALQYILILLTQNKPLSQVATDLELFFDEDSAQFTQWLAQVVDDFKAKPKTQTLPPAVVKRPQPPPPAAPTPVVAEKTKAVPAPVVLFEKSKPAAVESINRQVKLQSIAQELNAKKPKREATPEVSDDFISVPPEPQNSEPQPKKKALFTKRKSSLETGDLESQSRADSSSDEVYVQTSDSENIKVKAPTRKVSTGDEDEEFKVTVKNSPAQVLAAGSLVRCKYFPACTKGEKCEFFHPTEVCKFFPRCSNGNQCLFIHQNPFKKARPTPTPGAIPCKFGSACTRPDCFFSHPPDRKIAGSTAVPSAPTQTSASSEKKDIVCRYDTSCTKILCPYRHPKRDSFVSKPDAKAIEQQ